MRKIIYFLSFLSTVPFSFFNLNAQIGINTNTPLALLDLNIPDNNKLPEVKLNLKAKQEVNHTEINYNRGTYVMIDNNGYLYKNNSPAQIAIGLFDGRLLIPARGNTPSTILSYSDFGSILKFSFFTNYSLGEANTATVFATITYGRRSGFTISNLTAGTSVADASIPSYEFTNNQQILNINFTEGAGLRFTATIVNNVITIGVQKVNDTTNTIVNFDIVESMLSRIQTANPVIYVN